MLTSIWVWIKTSKIALWLAGVATALMALYVGYLNFKRRVRRELTKDMRINQLEKTVEVRRKQARIRDTVEREIRKLPPSWEAIEKIRESGKKIGIDFD